MNVRDFFSKRNEARERAIDRVLQGATDREIERYVADRRTRHEPRWDVPGAGISHRQ